MSGPRTEDEVCRYVIGLGGNMEPRADRLRQAVAAIAGMDDARLVDVSPVYETPPWGYEDQPPFLNGAVLIESSRSPRDMMNTLLEIEATLGRRRDADTIRWGPRPIDLDILFVPGRIVNEPDLTIPHPRLTERAFALRPLLDLIPDAVDPVSGARYDDCSVVEEVSGMKVFEIPGGLISDHR